MAREVLVVEDEPDIRRLVVLHLEREGFRCRTATTGSDALREVKAAVPDLVVLDLMLPEVDGLEVCRRLRRIRARRRSRSSCSPPNPTRSTGSSGSRSGPTITSASRFPRKELVARVRAVLRRTHPNQATPVLTVGPITLDAARHAVSLNGQAIVLTPKEFDLLQALLEAAGRVLSREFLLNRVWGYARADVIESRTVDVHVRRLRAKLGDAGSRIATVKSIGYRFETDPP